MRSATRRDHVELDLHPAATADVFLDALTRFRPHVVHRDEFDLVAIGRALLQDPQWAAKEPAGRFDELKPYDAAAVRTQS